MLSGGGEMKKTLHFCTLLILFTFVFCYSALAQRGTTITGTAVIYGSGFNTRTVTRPSTFTVTAGTPAAELPAYLITLQVADQKRWCKRWDSGGWVDFRLTGAFA